MTLPSGALLRKAVRQAESEPLSRCARLKRHDAPSEG
jgi:hypothetical protein